MVGEEVEMAEDVLLTLTVEVMVLVEAEVVLLREVVLELLADTNDEVV